MEHSSNDEQGGYPEGLRKYLNYYNRIRDRNTPSQLPERTRSKLSNRVNATQIVI